MDIMDVLLSAKLNKNSDGSSGTTNYNQLTNKPKINNIELSGNKTLTDLGIAARSDIPEIPVSDVQINGTSILSDGTANIVKASTSEFGVVKINADAGIKILDGGAISIVPAESSHMKVGSNSYKPVTPVRQHESTFYGLAKAAGDTTQSQSDNAVGQYTDNAKAAIKSMIGVSEDIDNLSNTKATAIYNTASGNVVSISDGAEGMPVKKIVGTIVPKQDLHGYTNPWSAGSGVNKIDLRNVDTTIGGLHVTGDAQGILSISGTRDDTTGWKVVKVFESLPEGNYVFSSSDSHFTCLLGYTQKTSTFTVSSGDVVRVALTNTVAGETYNVTNAKVQIETGSTASEWAPYENICPISGWTGANITRTGKNLLPNKTYSGRSDYLYLGQDNATDYPIYLKAGEYAFKADNSVSANLYFRVLDGAANTKVTPSGSQNINVTFTIPSDGWYQFYLYASGITSTNVTQFQLELGSTATDYEAYKGATLPINWQTEAGTIYGGTVTLYEDRSADVVATHTIVDLGALSWTKPGDSPIDEFIGVASPTVVKAYGRSNIICTAYATNTANASIPNLPDHTIGGQTNNHNIYIRDDTASTGAELKALLSGIYAVYEMNSPQTYHFDNVGELYTYLGTNNVWIDTGSITECDYPADTKTYVNNNGGAVDDVQINGTSILNNGVANIPIGSTVEGELGVLSAWETGGITITQRGRLCIYPATNNQVKGGGDTYRPVVPSTQHSAAFYGLAKAAGDTTMPNSSNAVGTYTEAAKTAIRAMLGVTDANGGMNVVTLTGTNITQTAAENTMYKCGELAELTFTAPASGITAVRFSSGSTPTVASFPGVTWLGDFDPDNLIANVTYEINIFDGVGVAGWA